ncbi:sugar phosphate isomerase/epimerase family protein [Cellulophaga tyrosinoxydans]|uniref:Sugar phosphate isomerase/epimerase n=1 Tax=Cellulophaga tyrosinoxydans TaxID=504486 RepID=A0A1W2A8Y7_9FLAO|nr:TIM barrel protein [Cellulophaga tyrosinoxydans]SMC57209.1 Sugar phosphate isomerase/epimerase [Cellulophaga tyrosinoxydans]
MKKTDEDQSSNQYTRQQFMKLSALGLASIPLFGFHNLPKTTKKVAIQPLNVHLFSKHLQFLEYTEMAKTAAEMGFSGLDVTVRDKGHVLPENVETDLPKVVAAMKTYGLSPEMITTNVLDSKDQNSIAIVNTASQLGFKNYRMGWLTYPDTMSIPESILHYKMLFSKLEALNKRAGITGVYQNHAGMHVGAPIWDIQQILSDCDPEYLGAQYDIRHAVVEGGTCWELGLNLIQPHIRTIVIKDFKWGQENGKWKPLNVPLGEGMVDFKRYFSLLKKMGITNPAISLHCEHDLGGAETGEITITIAKNEVIKRIKKDLTYLQTAWEQA